MSSLSPSWHHVPENSTHCVDTLNGSHADLLWERGGWIKTARPFFKILSVSWEGALSVGLCRPASWAWQPLALRSGHRFNFTGQSDRIHGAILCKITTLVKNGEFGRNYCIRWPSPWHIWTCLPPLLLTWIFLLNTVKKILILFAILNSEATHCVKCQV